jgi:hypothetical protein
MADLTKTGSNFANLGVDRYKQSAAPPAASAPAAATSGSSQMTQPIVTQAAAAGDMYKANQNPTTAASNYESQYKKFDTSTPQMKVGTSTSNLRVGSSGDQVSYVQRQLGIKADKQYGDNTRKAVMDYQKKYNLKVDGIVGDQTLSHMKRQEGFNKMRRENPIGAKALNDRTTSRIMAREPGSSSVAGSSSVKPAAPNFSGGKTGFTLMTNPDAVERAKREEELKRRLNYNRDRMESTEMSNKLIEAFMKLQSLNTSNIFEAAKKAKKLDPVGKEDEDIDNDGDKDKTDSYLHNRRKKIADAMKEDVTSPSSMRIKAPSYAKPKKEKEEGPSPKGDLPADVAKSMERERETNKEIGEPGSRQRSMIDSAKDAANRAGGLRSVEAIAKGVGAAYGQGIAKVADAVAGYKKPESKVYQNTGKSSIALKNEEVEYIDEAAGGLPAEHKKAIANHVKKMWGKGTVTFDKQDGKHFVTHNDGIESQVHSIHMKGGKAHVTHFMTVQEEVEQIDELKGYQGKKGQKLLGKVQKRAVDRLMKAADDGDVKNAKKNQQVANQAYDRFKEEVEFSEAELAHMAAILEGPVAPTPDDYSPNAFGSTASRSGTLTDEAIAEEEARRGRGRPKGSKSGSKHGSGSGTTGGVTHVVDQIRNAEKLGLSDGKGNYKLKHITGYTTSKVDGKTVSTPKTMEFSAPQKAANDFYKAFHGTEKPAHKESMTKAFVEKHSGKSLDPANTNKITLPKI